MKRWHTRQSKLDYRSKLIDLLCKQIGETKLPDGEQYWTICGECHDYGKPHDGTEIGQLITAGFITEDQFIGVDNNSDIIKWNRKAYPKATWICGRFEDVFSIESHKKGFNPGVVHLDYINEVPLVSQWVLMILNELVHMKQPAIVVANMVTNFRNFVGRDYSMNDVEGWIGGSEIYQRLLRQGKIEEIMEGIDTLPKLNGRMTALLWEVKSS